LAPVVHESDGPGAWSLESELSEAYDAGVLDGLSPLWGVWPMKENPAPDEMDALCPLDGASEPLGPGPGGDEHGDLVAVASRDKSLVDPGVD